MNELERIEKKIESESERIKSWEGTLTARPCINIGCRYFEEEKQYLGIATFEGLPPIRLCLKVKYGKLSPHICWRENEAFK